MNRQNAKPVEMKPDRLDDTNYDNSEFIFSWNRNQPMIRPNLYKCQKCNHAIKKNCDVSSCDKCGYPISIYGYRELESNILDNENDERPFTINNGLLGDDIENERIPVKRVKFANHTKVINYKNEADAAENDTNPETIKTTKIKKVVYGVSPGVSPRAVNPDDLIECLNTTDTPSAYVGWWSAGGCGCMWVILTIGCLALASYRNELKKDGNNNKSLIACIVFLPYMYLSYALIDYTTSPGK
jgi:hypothetical protein